jgi:Zn finger protein HypA/HybF involved in hydrogenase expression
MKIKCKNCNYEWDTKTKMIYVSCPSCLKKVKVEEIKA